MIYNALILCTGNSARSILAESILRTFASNIFNVYSAGSRPSGMVNPLALKVLAKYGHDTQPLHSKSWNEFCGPNAPTMDLVITVCDSAAAETCPVWPGSPVKVHLGFSDPSHVVGDLDRQMAAFDATYQRICDVLVCLRHLPQEKLDRQAFDKAVRHLLNVPKAYSIS